MTYRLRNIVIAVVLALLAALLTAMYVSNYQRRVDNDQKPTSVWVAKADFPPGTPASEIAGSLEQRTIPREGVATTAIADKKDIEGLVSSQWIYEGEQVTTRRFTQQGQGGPRAELKGNMRAIQIAGDKDQVLAGVLKAGDRVDLVGNIKVIPDKDIYAARIVLRDVRVLRAPQAPGPDAKLGGSNADYAVMLAVTDTQVRKLFFLTSGSTLRSKHFWALQLRPVVDPVDTGEGLDTIDSVLRDGIRRSTPSIVYRGSH